MKRNRIFAVLMAGVIAVGSLFVPTDTATAARSTRPAPKSLAADSAIVMELSTGTVLYSKNIHRKHYPASITKILTTLLTIENCDLDAVHTFTYEEAHGIEMGSSSLYCVPGEKFTVEKMLYGIMLQSANEMCLAAADEAAGTVDAFVDMMNQRVASLGLTDTHFANPNGLHDPEHYTTAYDMAVIARAAWQNPTFRKVTGTKTYSMGKTNKRKADQIMTLLNHHQMINGYKNPEYEYKYCVGGKTGYTSNAGNTLVTYAEKDGMQLVAVVMKSTSPPTVPNEYTDSTKLLNYGFAAYQKVDMDSKVLDDTNLFETYNGYFSGDQAPLRLSGNSSVVLPKGADVGKVQQEVTYDENKQLTEGENVIGTVTYRYQNKVVGSNDIIYDYRTDVIHLDQASREMVGAQIKDIRTRTEKHRALKEKVTGFFKGIGHWIAGAAGHVWIWIVIVAGVLVILLAVAVIVRLIRLAMSDRRSRSERRRRKQNRRERIRDISFSKKSRRNRSYDYTTSGRGKTMGRMDRSSRYSANPKKRSRNHKKTKESFGRSFYDF